MFESSLLLFLEYILLNIFIPFMPWLLFLWIFYGDKFKWTIEQSDWFFSNTTNIESDNLDWLFEEISDKSDSEYITENTRAKKNDKLAFAKKAYKDNILNKSKKWDKSGKFKIKYKKK